MAHPFMPMTTELLKNLTRINMDFDQTIKSPDLPAVFDTQEPKSTSELNPLGAQKHKIGLSMESPVDDPEGTLNSFNRQFGLNAQEKDAVEWAWPMEMGTTMFAVVNTYTRAAQWDELSAESSFRLSRVGGNILGMLN